MTSKHRLLRVLAWAGAVGLAAGVYVLLIRRFGRGLYCPIWSLTGLYCPGCGVSRMCLRLLRLDLAGALRANGLLLVTTPLLGGLLLARLARYVSRGRRDTPRWEEWSWRSLAVVFVLYGLLRNLPALSCLAPR